MMMTERRGDSTKPTERYVRVTTLPDRLASDDDPALRGTFGRKWRIAGTTIYSRHRPEARIALTRCAGGAWLPREAIRRAAYLHERGHVDILDDLYAQSETWPDAARLMSGYDVWQSEVEAWLRGLTLGRTELTYRTYTFALDALNTYRRGYGVSDEDWEAGRRLLLQCVSENAFAAARDYVPLEPDGTDAKPGGCFVPIDDDGAAEGAGPADDDGAPDDADTDGTGAGTGTWRLPAAVERAVVSGTMTLEQAARVHGLDPTDAPPHLRALDEVRRMREG